MAVLGNLGMLREQHEAELRGLVSQAIGAGAPTHELARVLGISRATVWRRFREELRAATQQTGVTSSTGFGIHPIEGGGFSPIVAEAKHARVDHGTPRSQRFTAADGAGPGTRVSPLDVRATTQRARAAQREALLASRRASQLTRAIAIELGNATRLKRQQARVASPATTDRSLLERDEDLIGGASVRGGSNALASERTAHL